MKTFFIAIASLCALFTSTTTRINAEIEYVKVKWLPTACIGSCALTVNKYFVGMPGAAEVIVNQQQGQGTIRWKPLVPFTYDYINTALRLTGLGTKTSDTRLRVRGVILHSPNAVILQSLGDNTQFVLLSPAAGSITQYVPKNNIDAHRLAPELRQRLLDGERDFCVVTIEGPLFEPQRMAGLYLIVEQVAFNRLAQR
jgi:hypothetical protein